MSKFIIRTVVTALAFMFVLPLIPGIDFHGNFMVALGAAILFSLLALLVDVIAIAISAVWTFSTLGLALIVLVPLWLLGFWIVPAVILSMTANLMPAHLTVHGWMSAFGGGLVMLIIGIATSAPKRKTNSD